MVTAIHLVAFAVGFLIGCFVSFFLAERMFKPSRDKFGRFKKKDE